MSGKRWSPGMVIFLGVLTLVLGFVAAQASLVSADLAWLVWPGVLAGIVGAGLLVVGIIAAGVRLGRR